MSNNFLAWFYVELYYLMKRFGEKPLGTVVNTVICLLIIGCGFLLFLFPQNSILLFISGIAIIFIGLWLIVKTVIQPRKKEKTMDFRPSYARGNKRLDEPDGTLLNRELSVKEYIAIMVLGITILLILLMIGMLAGNLLLGIILSIVFVIIVYFVLLIKYNKE